MDIENNYSNKIIQLLFNFEVNSEVYRHCLSKIFMHHEVRCKHYGFIVNNYIFTLLYLAMVSVQVSICQMSLMGTRCVLTSVF